VTIDGGEVASSASFGGGRNIELGALRLNNISRIEVTKVPTPDLPANAQGGMINAISKSGFERRDPQLSYRAYSTAVAWPSAAADRNWKSSRCNRGSIWLTSFPSTNRSP
jgi:outer membrane receptor for monomeric catechols